MRVRTLLAVVLLSVASACSKCGKPDAPAGEPIERLLPSGAVGVVVVPRLGDAGQKLKILEGLKVMGFGAQLRGFDDGKAFADALVNDLGIDVRSNEALERAGLDGARSAAVAALVTSDVYLVLPVKDAAKFHTTLEALASKRLGAGASGEQKFGETVVKTFSPQQGQPPRLGYLVTRGYALVTVGKSLGKLAGAATLTESDSLANDSMYKAELLALSKDRDVIVYLPVGTPLLAQAPFLSVTASLSLTPAGLSIAANGLWKGKPEELEALAPQEGRALLGYLPADAFLVTRFNGAPSKLAGWTKNLLGRHLNEAFERGGFDVKSEVLDQLAPGLVASLSLSDRPPLDKGMPDIDNRRTNPFSYAHLSGAATVKKPDAVMATFEKVVELAPRFGAEMTVKSRDDGQKAVLTTYAAGEGVHFAPKGDLVFFASPVQRLDALVKSDGKGETKIDGLGSEALSVVVDLRKLSASVRALPESAWGLGGFAMKATTIRWLDATDDLQRVTLTVGAKGQSVQARLMLSLGKP